MVDNYGTAGAQTTSYSFDNDNELVSTGIGAGTPDLLPVHPGRRSLLYRLPGEPRRWRLWTLRRQHQHHRQPALRQDNRLTSLTDWLSNTTSFTYDDSFNSNSNLKTITYPSSTSMSVNLTHDMDNNLMRSPRQVDRR